MTSTPKLWRIAVPAILSAALTLTLLVTFASPAKAADPYWTHLACRYDPDSISPITYRFFSVHSNYETAFKNAEHAWDGTTAPGYFKEDSWSVDPEINVTDGFYGSGWNAVMIGPCLNTGEWDGNEVSIDFNRTEMDGNSATSKKNTAMHEIGHAYGLDHVSSGCRLMRDSTIIDTCGATFPTPDDVAGVKARYK